MSWLNCQYENRNVTVILELAREERRVIPGSCKHRTDPGRHEQRIDIDNCFEFVASAE